MGHYDSCYEADERAAEEEHKEIKKLKKARHRKQKHSALRDKFAGDALRGMLSYDSHDLAPEEYAHNAYLQADEMLKAREK